MTDFYFVQPLDVLMLRGNKSFGDAGEHGESVMPPWPSLFAGAFRSALLGQDAVRLANFAAGQRLEGRLGDVLGTTISPGSFRINWVSLAQSANDAARASCAIPLPADLVAFSDAALPALEVLTPTSLATPVSEMTGLPLTALLRRRKSDKPESGCWLAGTGLDDHLSGRPPPHAPVSTSTLFKREPRLGIALDAGTRTAADGAIYTTEALAFAPDAGFLIGIDGLQEQLPPSGLLRLGGDGRGAAYRRIEFTPPRAPLERIASDHRFRLILATHGLFDQGSLPDRVVRQDNGSYRLTGEGFAARLACAAVPRHEVVSGWDLALWQPKPAQRVAPAGSVYWFDQFEGEADKLANWVAAGLWNDNPDPQRRAEGFNRAWLAVWPHAA